MKTPTKHTVILKYGTRDLWIVDEGDAWEVWCVDCGYRLGTTTNPRIYGREEDALRLVRSHDKGMHL